MRFAKRRSAHPTRAVINGGRELLVFDANGALLRAFPAAGADAALSGLSLGEAAE